MHIEDFDFELPDGLIAQRPLENRHDSRMMLVDRASGKISDKQFSDFPAQILPGDVIVLNNTKVFPARLHGRTETGAVVEVFLVSELADGSWEVLARPGRRLKPGKRVEFSEDLSAEVISKSDDGKVLVLFTSSEDFAAIVDRIGETPLPPYISREEAQIDDDRERYQTVYAKNRGAIAAPTAGLHFNASTLEELRQLGAEVLELTLHVGYGTFEPVRVDDLSEHRVSAERYEISPSVAAALNAALADGRRIVAIGTTTTRALESNIAEFHSITSGSHYAELTITPGFEFRAVGALLTNFHLPRSSLLVLTSVFGGRELIMEAYRHAVLEKYRFYSYGDCMFIS